MCFICGLVLMVGTLVSPLAPISDELIWAHMVEHLLIGDLAVLLIVLGLTGPLLAPLLRLAPIRSLRGLSHPTVAFTLWVVNLYLWHLPALYQAAVGQSWLHELEHLLMVALGLNMWLALLGPLPKPTWFNDLGKLLYVIALRLCGGLLGNILLWSGIVLYPDYGRGEALHGISPLADQSIAGAILMIWGSVVTALVFAWLFFTSARRASERQALLDRAVSRGVDIDTARIARAVASGRTSEMEQRIEREAGTS
jgi:cytochrome c oxidase assembly factor CtaG